LLWLPLNILNFSYIFYLTEICTNYSRLVGDFIDNVFDELSFILDFFKKIYWNIFERGSLKIELSRTRGSSPTYGLFWVLPLFFKINSRSFFSRLWYGVCIGAWNSILIRKSTLFKSEKLWANRCFGGFSYYLLCLCFLAAGLRLVLGLMALFIISW